MRLEQLEYLVVISKCKSLSEASKRLFITQQSLGKSITNLEKELGVTLLTRACRGCYLTKEGVEVLDAAKGILHQIDELKSRYNTCNSIAGDLIVLCCPAVHETVLPATIETLSHKMPQMKVTALAKDSFHIPDLHRRLSNCGDETVVGVLNIPDCNTEQKNKIDANQEFQPLADDYWVACINKSHPLATKTNITLKELFKEPLVIEYPDYPEVSIDHVTLSHFEQFGKPNIKKNRRQRKSVLFGNREQQLHRICQQLLCEKQQEPLPECRLQRVRPHYLLANRMPLQQIRCQRREGAALS